MTSTITSDTTNPMDAKLSALRGLFPEAFREDKLDTGLLSATLGEAVSYEKEAYGMTWAGKADARRQILTPTNTTLSGDPEASVAWDTTQNLLIEGDNLTVLKLLQKGYTKQVKMIYIDPPYNTGKDFVYRDNFHTDREGYETATGQRDSEGQKLVQNTETNGRYHSDWLSMMYPRLHLARNLLRDDGVIFVSIDDHEVHNLRKIMDEVFGEENFGGQIVWQTATDNNPTQISTEHEYVICYVKNINEQDAWEVPSDKGKIIQEKYDELKNQYGNDIDTIQSLLRKWIKSQTNGNDLSGVSHYSYVDEKGVYYPGNSANTKPGGYTYDIIHPVTKMVCSKPEYGYRWTIDTFNEADRKGDVQWGEDEQTIPKIKKRLDTVSQKLKSYYYEDNRTTSGELKALFEGVKVFNNPKSVFFLKHMFKFVTGKNDILLDFFAGSGTTGHSVMSLNVEEKVEAVKNGTNPDEVGNRKYICVQLPELTDKKSEAFKAGYKKISDITAERLRRAGKKIAEENKDLTLDTGFRLYRLTDSCYKVANVNYNSDNEQATLESFEKALKDGLSPLRDGVTEDDIITENLIKEGFPLNITLTKEKIGQTAFIHAETEGKRLFISFDDSIPLETIDEVQKGYKEAIFVVYDSALTDPLKVMLASRVTLRTI